MKKWMSGGLLALSVMLSAPVQAYTPLDDVTLCGKISTYVDPSGWIAYSLQLDQPFTPTTEGYNTEDFSTNSIFIDGSGTAAADQIVKMHLSKEDDVCISGQLKHDSDDTDIDFNTRKPFLIRKQTSYPDPETSGVVIGEVSKIFLEAHVCFIEVEPDFSKPHYFEISYGERAKFAEYLGEMVEIHYKLGELTDIRLSY